MQVIYKKKVNLVNNGDIITLEKDNETVTFETGNNINIKFNTQKKKHFVYCA